MTKRTSQHTLVARAGQLELFERYTYCAGSSRRDYIVEDSASGRQVWSGRKRPSISHLVEREYRIPSGTPARWANVSR